MKNIVTILFFTVLFVAGFSAKSGAQEWRWHRAHYACADTAFDKNMDHCGRWGWGCGPRRYYRRMMWCGGDTATCNKWCGAPYRWSRWENWKESDADFAKYHQEMETRWKNHEEDMKKEEKEFHDNWSKYDGDYGWGWRWHRRWYNDYYYRGAGK